MKVTDAAKLFTRRYLRNKKINVRDVHTVIDGDEEITRRGLMSRVVKARNPQVVGDLNGNLRTEIMARLSQVARANAFVPARALAVVEKTAKGYSVGISWSGRQNAIHGEANGVSVMDAFQKAIPESVKAKKSGVTSRMRRSEVKATATAALADLTL